MSEDVNWKARQSVAKVVLPIAFEIDVYHHGERNAPLSKPELADCAAATAARFFEIVERNRDMDQFRDYYLDDMISWKMVTFPEEINQ